MSSPITLTGFNNIDFGAVLDALMQQERIPVTLLEDEHSALSAQRTAFATFATRLGALESAASALRSATSFNGRAATISNTGALSASVGGGTPIGTYEVLVSTLARAQVTGTSSSHADKDSTIVASGGTLTIAGTAVTIAGDVTLEGLADAINQTSGIGVTAAVVQNGGNFQLALTGHQTGAANAFAIANNLTGGSGVAFGANAQNASDATGTVNGIAFSSATNQVSGAIPGATVTLMRADPVNSVVVTITGDNSSVRESIQEFVNAYNSVVGFIDQQQAAAGRQETDNIGRDPLIRGLRTQLSGALLGQFGVGGTFTSLSEVGLSFARNGQMTLNDAELDAALDADSGSVQRLFRGDGVTPGVFQAFSNVVTSYTSAGGLVPNATERIGDQLSRVSDRIGEMERRLEIRRAALQREFAAADQVIAQLNASGSSLGSLANQFSLF